MIIGDEHVLEHDGQVYWTKISTGAGRVTKTFGNALPSITKGHFLDVGCSTGTTTHEWQLQYPQCSVSGIDRNRRRIGLARRTYPDIEFWARDGYHLERHYTEQFAGISVMNNFAFVLPYMPSSRIARHMQNFLSSLSPNGYLLLSADEAYMILRNGPRIESVAAHQRNVPPVAYTFNQKRLATICDIPWDVVEDQIAMSRAKRSTH